MSAPSPVRGEKLERALALRMSGLQWAQIGAELGCTEDQVSSAVRRHNAASGTTSGASARPPPPASPRPPGVVSGGPDNYLIISDLQLPYTDSRALTFCQQVRREYQIPQENILCVGDEFDFYWASRFPKSPDAPHTANQELDEARAQLARWTTAFPVMRICLSNHGNRMAKAAERAGIPAQILRSYREVLGVPEGWQWSESWIIKASKHPFRIEHGHHKPGGHTGLRTRPIFRGISTAWGHEHTEPAAIHLDTDGFSGWGMRVGALMTTTVVPANSYAAENAYKPTLSCGVVLDGGRLPLVVRL